MPVNDDLEAMKRVEAIGHHLRGLGPETQGGILALLLARWLAGHHTDNPAQLNDIHDALLDVITTTTKTLLPSEIARIHGTQRH